MSSEKGKRTAVPGFIPYECGGGGGFKPGDRVIVTNSNGLDWRPKGRGVVTDAYNRASDMWSPYSAAVTVKFDDDKTGFYDIECFIDWDGVKREE